MFMIVRSNLNAGLTSTNWGVLVWFFEFEGEDKTNRFATAGT